MRLTEVPLSISSMTGYARAEGRDGSVSWVWEAKSVNGRGLELRLRLPSGYDALDVAARELAPQFLKRGNVQLGLTVTQASDTHAPRINQAVLEQILDLCTGLQARYPSVTAPSWDGLLALKGVIETGSEDQSALPPQRLAAMRADLEAMLKSLGAMRQVEGKRIAAVLSAQVDSIADLAKRAEGLASLRPEAQRDRLRSQVALVLDNAASLSEDRLNTEVALLAVKADVREELDRLDAHVAAVRDLIAGGGAVGRKLDFLSQEFIREANTLCSKAQDVELTRLGLDLKVVIDQFREQVQNIE